MNLTLPEKVTVSSAEELLDTATRKELGAGPFHLDCQSCKHISLGAGYRIGNLLRVLAGHGALNVTIPNGTYSADSVPQEFFLSFTRSGLGQAIAKYAMSVHSADTDVTVDLKEYYKRTSTYSSHGAAYLFDIHLGTIDVEDEARFGRLVGDLLLRVNAGVSALDRASLSDAIALCFEGSQNVTDHAAKKPFRGSSILSYLSVRYYRTAAKSDEGMFAGYIKRATRELGKNSRLSWLEIAINDDGNGIASRQTQDPHVYRGPIEVEETAFREALAKSSVKLKAGDSKVRGGVAGEGFSRMRRSLRHLKAFASVRSGRCFATFDGLSPVQDLFNLTPGKFGLAYGYMPGTALQVVIPLVEISSQQSLPLNS